MSQRDPAMRFFFGGRAWIHSMTDGGEERLECDQRVGIIGRRFALFPPFPASSRKSPEVTVTSSRRLASFGRLRERGPKLQRTIRCWTSSE